MTHERIAAETDLSLSTVGRAIRWLKREGVIRQIRSIPSRRARRIQTYELLVGESTERQNDLHRRSNCLPRADQIDRLNPKQTKENPATASRSCASGGMAVQIGDLIARLSHA
jgi:DNA-binding Lrp family transcriptional regulator